MWGEFEDYYERKPDPETRDVIPPQTEKPSQADDIAADADRDVHSLPLKDRIIKHIASSSLTLKSQQRYEPDLTFEERMDLTGKLLEKPGNFLYRFGKHLLREHFQYFIAFEGDPEVDHYVTESLKHLNKHTAKIRVRNRRYAAMQELRRSGNYFSEKEMERRDPLLYDQLIARHQTEEERRNCLESGEENEVEMKFSSLLLQHIDNCSGKSLENRQQEDEDDIVEEEDSDEETEYKEEEEVSMDDGLDSGEKQLFKEEFFSSVYQDFLIGKDKEFDYSQVDASDAYDLLEVRARDEEERYFDEDDDDSQFVNEQNDAEDSAMCCG